MREMYAELGENFEKRILQPATNYAQLEKDDEADHSVQLTSNQTFNPDLPETYVSSRSYSILVGLEEKEIKEWKKACNQDPLLNKIILAQQGNDSNQELHSQYKVRENGLVYFEDWNSNWRLCVPSKKRIEIMKEVHDTISEASHGGYAKTYNKIAATYYWPRMSRDIKKIVTTCDICQKAKHKCHAPAGLLQPIPISNQPFEVVSMDFVPELPKSEGFDNILVIVDKLTKYAIFVPTTVNVGEKETEKLFFEHVISQYGIPHQVITDHDTRWRNDFWKEICKQMGMKRSLTTAYHPQADGQTEILNQTLEVSLRAYVGPDQNDWKSALPTLALAYNSTPHTATGFSPAFLLQGFYPITGSTIIHVPDPIS